MSRYLTVKGLLFKIFRQMRVTSVILIIFFMTKFQTVQSFTFNFGFPHMVLNIFYL